MSDSPEPGIGDVQLKLADNLVLTLTPTADAALTLSRVYGGLTSILERIGRLELDVIVDVIARGAGPQYSNAKLRAQLAKACFKAGLTDNTGGVAAAASRYVSILANGGKPAVGDPDTNTDDEEAAKLDPQKPN